MGILVLKFGGSSVATIDKIQAVARRVAKISLQHRCVVVVSAMGDETDILLEQAAALNPRHHSREYDMLLATGEQKSAALLSMALQAQNVPACSLTGWQAKIQTTMQHAHARIVHIDTNRIEECWKNNIVPVIAGFQGVCEDEITTLGRGGSDLTAVALAAALHADECQIFTDVDGVYSADPRIVPQATRWSEITYSAMLELASVGAQVLHNRAVELACKMHIKLRVLSSFVEGEGTMVAHQVKKISTVAGIVMQPQQAIIHITYLNGDAHYHALLTLLDNNKVFMGTLHLSHYKARHNLLSFALPMANAEKLQAMLKTQLGDDLEHIEYIQHQTQISVIGFGIQSSERVFFQVNQWMAKQRVSAHLLTSSESRLSFYIDEPLAKSVTRDLHDLFHLQALADENS